MRLLEVNDFRHLGDTHGGCHEDQALTGEMARIHALEVFYPF